eukprot:5215203-Prymnesium_polylepis.2
MPPSPRRVVRERRVAPAGSVALHVGLVHDVQPVHVRQPQPVRVVRVVRRADRVDVQRLDRAHVGAHGVAADDVTRERVVLVPVDALEQQRRPVEQQPRAAHLDRPEADEQREGLEHGGRVAGRALQREHRAIEVRRLGAPQPRPRHDRPELHLRVGRALAARRLAGLPSGGERDRHRHDVDRRTHLGGARLGVGACDALERRRREGAVERQPELARPLRPSPAERRGRAQVAQPRADGHHSARRVRRDGHVADVQRRPRDEIDVAREPREAPHVLRGRT